MTPYRYTFFQGKPFIDLTEDKPDDEAPDITSAEVNQIKSYPTPSRSPEASSSRPPTNVAPDRIIKPLPRSQSTEVSSRAIDGTIKIKVAIALSVDGRRNLDREKLYQETGLSRQQLADLIRSDGSVWKVMMGAAHSLG